MDHWQCSKKKKSSSYQFPLWQRVTYEAHFNEPLFRWYFLLYVFLHRAPVSVLVGRRVENNTMRCILWRDLRQSHRVNTRRRFCFCTGYANQSSLTHRLVITLINTVLPCSIFGNRATVCGCKNLQHSNFNEGAEHRCANEGIGSFE